MNKSEPAGGGPLLAEDYRKARKEVSDIVIAPFDENKAKGVGYNLAASMLVYSVNKKRLVKVKENDREVYIEIAPHDTVLTLSHEYLVVDGDIAGTFHSKVRCSAMGLGNVSTTLDPNWRGKLLFSLNNPTKRKIKLVIEEKNDGARKAVGLITMVLYRIAGKEEHITAKELHLDNPPMRTDIWQDLTERPSGIHAQAYEEFQKIVLAIVSRIMIPILPFFIGLTFCGLSYEGSITKQVPVFLKIIIIVLIGHYIWMTLLYTIAGLYSKKNPIEVIRHYGPAYLTSIGTMSSAATLAVALQCAGKSKVLRKDMVSFGIPLFANIHLCGSVLTEVFFCMTVSKILYGTIPSAGTMILFCVLLGIFAIGAPGVPGGTVMASLGLITGVLGFNDTGTALMLTIFALQDSFGTACNVTGDGALTLILTGYTERHGIKEGTDN